jgi:septum formation protein
MTGLVLASTSTTRAAMLRAAGVLFRVVPSEVNEASATRNLQSKGADATQIAAGLAAEKALAVSRRSRALILGADTVVALDGEIISKCPSLAAADTLLRRLSGRSHLLVSAAALARDGDVLWSHASPVTLTMRPLSEGFLANYLAAEGEALLSTVGCYRLEGRGAQLFVTVEGDYFSVLGLPLLPLLAQLRKEGVIQS